MNIAALLEVLPQVVLLSTFPFIFYWFTRPLPASSKRATVITAKLVLALFCAVGYVIVCAMYAIFWIGSGMSGGGAGLYPLQRLLTNPLQVPVAALVFPAAAAFLAIAKKGTLGMWAFAIGAGFISYYAGLGWLPIDMDWLFVIASAVLGGLCGLAAGFVLSRVSEPGTRAGKVPRWSIVGAACAAIGMATAWPAVQGARRGSQPGDINYAPFSIDPGVMLSLLLIAVVVWFALSIFVAIVTGYIKVNRGLPRPVSATE